MLSGTVLVMGVSLSQYRIAIGYFNRCKFVTSGFCIKCNKINIIFMIFILILLMCMAGDIESNPGPSNNICKNLNICHVNIRSLSRATLLALKTSLATVYDIITISQTHLHAGVPNNVFDLKGYHDILRKDRGARGGGVAIYIKEEIS
jgi:hypothetical protein